MKKSVNARLYRTSMVAILLCIPLIYLIFSFTIGNMNIEPTSNPSISWLVGQMDKMHPAGSGMAFVPTSREAITSPDSMRVVRDPRCLAYRLPPILSMSAAMAAAFLFRRFNPVKQRIKRISLIAVSGGGHAPPLHNL